MVSVCGWSMEGRGGRRANEQIAIYFSQIRVYSLNDIIYNEVKANSWLVSLFQV